MAMLVKYARHILTASTHIKLSARNAQKGPLASVIGQWYQNLAIGDQICIQIYFGNDLILKHETVHLMIPKIHIILGNVLRAIKVTCVMRVNLVILGL